VPTAVIGLGNPILADDGVGIRALRILREMIPPSCDVVLKEACLGGLSLMEEMVGFDRAVVIDAMVTGRYAPGTVREIGRSDPDATRNIVSSHDTNLWAALGIGRAVGLRLPDEVRVIGIEAEDVETFGERLSEAAEAAARTVAETLLPELCASAEYRGTGCGR
jgi:hydrogenase maturation protease